MKVFFVCLQGLTSGILAQKLTDYAKERQEDYIFQSVSCYDVVKQLETDPPDVILLTPQAKTEELHIRAAAQEQGIPVWIMLNTSLGASNVAEDYMKVVAQINGERRISHGHTFWKGYAQAVGATVVLAIFIWFLGWLFLWGYHTWNIDLLYFVYECTAGVVCLYAGAYLGYRMASLYDFSHITYILLGMMTVLLFSPFWSEQVYLPPSVVATVNALFRIRYLSLDRLLWYLPFVCVACFLCERVVSLVRKSLARKGRIYEPSNHVLFGVVLTINMTGLLAVRVLLNLCLPQFF